MIVVGFFDFRIWFVCVNVICFLYYFGICLLIILISVIVFEINFEEKIKLCSFLFVLYILYLFI